MMSRTPLELVSALGLTKPGPSSLTPARISELRDRRRSFDWTHLGTSDLPVGELLTLIDGTDGLCPPRSGHLGNWEDIALGRAGAMDFNQAICARRLGYPLIYCFNQTEDAALSAGDWVYLPGSLARRGERTVLPLFTWDGAQFVERGRDVPLFVPLVMTEHEGERLSLVELHMRRMQSAQFSFRLEAAFIDQHRAEVRAMLTVLLEEASRRDNPRRAFADLISHAATLDGRVARATVRRDGAGYWLEDTFFSSTEAFVDAALVPFALVADPKGTLSDIGALPTALPIVAGLLVGIFSALLGTHYPNVRVDRARMTQPFNPHFHWGARDMAGYPPKRNGYFSEKSTIRSMRQICDTLVGAFPEIDPLFFVLMPAAMFMLCPPDAYPRDGEHLAALFDRVCVETAQFAGTSDDRMMTAIDGIVQRWLADAQSSLSPYLLNRFNAKRGVLHDTEVPAASSAAEPEGFRRLSVRQACMVVGALGEALKESSS